MRYWTGKGTVWRRIRASFSPEILQARAVKGLMSKETIRLIRDGEKRGGKGIWRWGEREIIYLLLYCHHQNDSCIKMGSIESHFNVSLIVRDKVTRQCPCTDHSF